MGRSISRREVLGNIVSAGAGALLVGGKVSASPANIRIADQPVEIGLAQLSPHTVRLTVVPLEYGQSASIPNDGSIVCIDAKFKNLPMGEGEVPVGGSFSMKRQ